MTTTIIVLCMYVAGWFTAFLTSYLRGFSDAGINHPLKMSDIWKLMMFSLLSWFAVLLILVVIYFEWQSEREARKVMKQCHTNSGLAT